MGNTKSIKIVIKRNLFQPAPQNYRSRMENIEDIQTSNLLIRGTQAFMINRDNAIPLSLPVEELLVVYDDIPLFEDIEILDNAISLSLPVEESLVPCDDIFLFEDIEILAPVTENPNQMDHPVDSEKDYFRQIRNDLLVRSN
ncbi:29070_t:CDS:2, partial [Gigaspora margarita]